MDAGRLDRKLQFSEPYAVDDGAGNLSQGFAPQFSMAANIRFLRGSETVLAARLQAKGPVIVTVRNCANTRRLTAEWRCKDERSGTLYQIKEPPRPAVGKDGKEDRGMIEFMATSGVAG